LVPYGDYKNRTRSKLAFAMIKDVNNKSS
ncbi:MAG: hypothetical protein UT60_C0021G0010, partial [candidate division CPR2 bacterium GW2011_GWD2_39_7]